MTHAVEADHYVFAFTSHGFGHLTRTLRVLDAFLEAYPRVDATVCARAPRWLIERRVRRPIRIREVDYEPGAAQKNCFEVDVDATRQSYREFNSQRESRLRTEREFLRETECRGLVVDVPALPVRAASELGVPVAGVSNFTWDWILEPIVDSADVETLRADYACGDLFLSLPFGPGRSPFRSTEHAPLVGPRAALGREEVLRGIGLEQVSGRPIVLVCFGGWGAVEWPPICVSGCEDLQFLLVGDLPVEIRGPTLRLPDEIAGGIDVSDLVAVADVVLTKPGYGIASECVLHRTPMVGVKRRDFRESAELERGLEQAGPFVSMELDDFFAGFWERSIRSALSDRTPWLTRPGGDASVNGARTLARRLGGFFGLEEERGEPSHRVLSAGESENGDRS